MKRKGFSLSEVIIATSIFLIVIFPTININKAQIGNLNKIKSYNYKLDFLFSLVSYIYSLPYEILDEIKIELNNYEDFQKHIFLQNFDFSCLSKNEKFILKIKITRETIDFYHSKINVKIIIINLSQFNKNFNIELIKFED